MDDIDLNNLPDNPEALHKAFEQIEAGEDLALSKPENADEKAAAAEQEQAGNQQEQVASEEQPPKEVKQEPAADEQPKPKAEEVTKTDEAAGVATKDGKHIIPYSVLKSERDRAARAEQIARNAEERLAALQAQLAAGSQGANTGEGARTEQQAIAASDISDTELESIKDDFPVIYKAIKASMAKQQALEGQLRPVEERVRMTQAEREREAAQTVQEAIDAVPKLAHIQASNHGAFELAKQIDATLRTQAAWADKPLNERFSKVVEMVESAIGPIDLPGQAQAQSQAPEQSKASPSAEELMKAAKAKAAQAAKVAGTHVPTSLSEFPAGQSPVTNEREAAEQLTPQQLYTKFAGMSADQMEEYLQSL